MMVESPFFISSVSISSRFTVQRYRNVGKLGLTGQLADRD